MTSSENLASLEPWSFRSSFNDSFFSESFFRDNETLTRALQQSFCTDTDSLDSSNSQFFNNTIKPEPTLTSSVSDPDSFPKRRNTTTTTTTTISNGKITKRKSRASKKSSTTFITADPSNFRQMVQQVTGIHFADVPVVPVLKPEPQRLGHRVHNYCLPTLDTSEYFMNNQQDQVVGPTGGSTHHVSYAPVTEGAAALDFNNFQGFPTLESWRVM